MRGRAPHASSRHVPTAADALTGTLVRDPGLTGRHV